ncbi:MAG: type II secretion system protein GspD, partial [Bacilli bacterium]
MDRASLAFDGTKLWVTNSRRNLDKVRNILLRYNEIKQVEIEAKFMEVNQGALKELGFNWNVYNMDADGKSKNVLFATNNRTLGQTTSDIQAGSQPITILQPADQVQPGAENPYTVPQVIHGLPSTINLGSSAINATNTLLGVINGYNVDLVVSALEQKQGSDLLCAPKVTVISGVTATITVSQQMRYPETWGDVQSNVGTSSSTGSGSSAGVTITPGTPQDFTTTDVGVVMTVTPNVEEDGSINLVLNPKVTEFEGFMEYGGVAVALSAGTIVTVPSGFIQPVFSVREVNTTVTVFDGATVVMGGLVREEVRSVNDQVPILGDIPLIGRLFKSKGESRQKKNLLIFVTANRISPGGSVGREQFQ